MSEISVTLDCDRYLFYKTLVQIHGNLSALYFLAGTGKSLEIYQSLIVASGSAHTYEDVAW